MVGKVKGAIAGVLVSAAVHWEDIQEALGYAAEETSAKLAEEAEVQKRLGAIAMDAAASMGKLAKELDAVSLIKLIWERKQ